MSRPVPVVPFSPLGGFRGTTDTWTYINFSLKGTGTFLFTP